MKSGEKDKNNRHVWWLLGLVVVVTLLGAGIWFYLVKDGMERRIIATLTERGLRYEQLDVDWQGNYRISHVTMRAPGGDVARIDLLSGTLPGDGDSFDIKVENLTISLETVTLQMPKLHLRGINPALAAMPKEPATFTAALRTLARDSIERAEIGDMVLRRDEAVFLTLKNVTYGTMRDGKIGFARAVAENPAATIELRDINVDYLARLLAQDVDNTDSNDIETILGDWHIADIAHQLADLKDGTAASFRLKAVSGGGIAAHGGAVETFDMRVEGAFFEEHYFADAGFLTLSLDRLDMSFDKPNLTLDFRGMQARTEGGLVTLENLRLMGVRFPHIAKAWQGNWQQLQQFPVSLIPQIDTINAQHLTIDLPERHDQAAERFRQSLKMAVMSARYGQGLLPTSLQMSIEGYKLQGSLIAALPVWQILAVPFQSLDYRGDMIADFALDARWREEERKLYINELSSKMTNIQGDDKIPFYDLHLKGQLGNVGNGVFSATPLNILPALMLSRLERTEMTLNIDTLLARLITLSARTVGIDEAEMRQTVATKVSDSLKFEAATYPELNEAAEVMGDFLQNGGQLELQLQARQQGGASIYGLGDILSNLSYLPALFDIQLQRRPLNDKSLTAEE